VSASNSNLASTAASPLRAKPVPATAAAAAFPSLPAATGAGSSPMLSPGVPTAVSPNTASCLGPANRLLIQAWEAPQTGAQVPPLIRRAASAAVKMQTWDAAVKNTVNSVARVAEGDTEGGPEPPLAKTQSAPNESISPVLSPDLVADAPSPDAFLTGGNTSTRASGSVIETVLDALGLQPAPPTATDGPLLTQDVTLAEVADAPGLLTTGLFPSELVSSLVGPPLVDEEALEAASVASSMPVDPLQDMMRRTLEVSV